MKLIITKKFVKDTHSINDNKLKTTLLKVIEDLQINEDIRLISLNYDIKKLKGTKEYYRIRIGDYRMGFELYANEVILHRILHRKEMYNKFP